MGFLQVLPLILLILFVGAFGWVGYQMYLYSQQLGQRGQDYMQKHNVAYSKDGGVKVGVKQTSDEEYSSKIQRNLVNTWNQSSFPDDYKSRFWNKEEANKAKSK